MSKKRDFVQTGCPCGNPSFEDCCKPYLTGDATAKDALSLMRSRYSAYVTENEPYLRETWVDENRPSGTIIVLHRRAALGPAYNLAAAN